MTVVVSTVSELTVVSRLMVRLSFSFSLESDESKLNQSNITVLDYTVN